MLDPLVVTATKFVQDPLETHTSISVMDRERTEMLRISSTPDINDWVPNFRFINLGGRGTQGFMNIRGLMNTASVGAPAVAFYIDDVPYTDDRASYLPLFGLERIEVLRGPQGSLYGRNTQGGLVNIVTRDPGAWWGGDIGLQATSERSLLTRANVSGPLPGKTLSLGLSGLAETRDGSIRNTFTGEAIDHQKTWSGRAKLIWEPTDGFRARLTASGHSLDDGGGYIAAPVNRNVYNAAFPGAEVDRFELWIDEEGKNEVVGNDQSLKLSLSLPNVEMVSISTRRQQENELLLDFDFTALPSQTGIAEVNSLEWTQELRLQSPGDGESFSWILGIFAAKRHWDYVSRIFLGPANPLVAAGFFPTGAELRNSDVVLDDSTAAVFGQFTRRFLEDRLGFTAGLRYEYFRQEGDKEVAYYIEGSKNPPGVPPPFLPLPQPGLFSGSVKDHELLPKFALDYRITPDVMTYLNAAKGYKAGGLNFITVNEDQFLFDKETSWTFEWGLKTALAQDALTIRLSAFYTRVSDLQDLVIISPPFGEVTNAGDADMKGFEAEADWVPSPAWLLSAAFGYVDARYRDYQSFITNPDLTTTPASFSGKRIVYTPEYTGSLLVRHSFNNGIYLQGETVAHGSAYFDQDNTMKQDAVVIFNARAGLIGNGFDLFLFGENLTNREYFTLAFPDRFTPEGRLWFGVPNKPLRVGLGATFRF
jgi:iron complex outermembrane recepter protein